MFAQNPYASVHAALFIMAKKGKQTQIPLVDEWINRIWYIHAMEHSTIKRNGILMHATTWMSFENTILSAKSQSQKATYCMIRLYKMSVKSKQK